MNIRAIILIFFLSCIACKTDNENIDTKNNQSELKFDKEKWLAKDGNDYLYRVKMLNDVVYNDTIRKLTKVELLELLGEPDYQKEDHLYYRITETRLGNWTLKARTMVIKLVNDEMIDWIKIHG